MFEHILFPTDGSEEANAVLEHVLDVADDHGATLHILNVADTTHDSVTQIRGGVIDVLEREGEQIVEEVAEQAAERQVTSVTEVLQGGVPETITAYAEKYGIELIAMATHGRTGVGELLLGSTTERVIWQTSVPVLTVRPDDDFVRYPYQNVLVPTDGSECATAALERGVDIVNKTGATLHVLSVVDVKGLGVDVHSEVHVDALEEQANEVVSEARAIAEEGSVDSIVEAVERGSSVYRAIQSYVDEHDIDLVVMGTHGRTDIDRYLFGSTTGKTVRTASVPVVTVPDSPSN